MGQHVGWHIVGYKWKNSSLAGDFYPGLIWVILVTRYLGSRNIKPSFFAYYGSVDLLWHFEKVKLKVGNLGCNQL